MGWAKTMTYIDEKEMPKLPKPLANKPLVNKPGPVPDQVKPRPRPLSINVTVVRLAEITGVNRRTVYRWVKDYGKETVVKICSMVIMDLEGVVKPQELADALKVSKSTVYRWIAEGKLHSFNFFGDTVRIPVSEVRRLWAEAEAKGIVEPVPMSERELKGLFANAAA